MEVESNTKSNVQSHKPELTAEYLLDKRNFREVESRAARVLAEVHIVNLDWWEFFWFRPECVFFVKLWFGLCTVFTAVFLFNNLFSGWLVLGFRLFLLTSFGLLAWKSLYDLNTTKSTLYTLYLRDRILTGKGVIL